MFHIGNENRQVFYSSLVFLSYYIILAIIATRPVFAFDAYWHLQMGKDLIENGLSPWVDHYSFSYFGKTISTVPVVFQVVLYQFVSFLGESDGFYYIRLFYVTLLLSVLFVYFRKINASGFIVFLLLPLIAYFIHIRLMVRPEIFSYVLMVICLMLYLEARKSFSTRQLIYISLLLLFWVNYHSPVVGYIIVFGLFLDKAINKYIYGDESFTWKFWLLWGCIIFLIGFMRPHGLHFMVVVLNVMADDFGRFTQEYTDSYTLYSNNIVINISWMLSVYVAIWSFLKKQYGFVFIAVIFTYFSLSTARMITATTLVNLCILALYFSQASYSHHISGIRPFVKKTLLIVSICVSLFAFYSIVIVASESLKKNDDQIVLHEKRYPVQVADFMKQSLEGGNVLNTMQTGGYLLNKLAPDFKVFFDGRTSILYPIDFVIYNQDILDNKEKLNEVIEQYGVKYAVYENTVNNYISLKNNRELSLIFADENYILFAGDEITSFPLTSKLLVFPPCWDESWSEQLPQEIELARSLFNDSDYTLRFVVDFLENYLSHQDKKQFFETLKYDELHSDVIRRLAFYFSWHNNNADAAIDSFRAIGLKTEYDILIHAYNLAKDNRFRESENLLYHFYVITKYVKKKYLTYDKMEIMIHTLELLNANNELQRFESAYIGELEEKLIKADYTRGDVLSFDNICK